MTIPERERPFQLGNCTGAYYHCINVKLFPQLLLPLLTQMGRTRDRQSSLLKPKLKNVDQ
jgi:hypothetical protein